MNIEVLYPRHRKPRRWVPGLVVVLVLFFMSSTSLGGLAHPQHLEGAPYGAQALERVLPYGITAKDVLFAARTAWSESSRSSERYFVLWSIRNRVERQWNGDSTYLSVVLSPSQYSCWMQPDCRDRLKSLTLDTPNEEWQETINMTVQVMTSPLDTNPIPGVMHFYSPVSMDPPGRTPDWARGITPDIIIPGERLARFHFYSKTAS